VVDFMGITCGDPFGGTLQSQTNPDGFLFIFLQPQLKSSFQLGFRKINNPADAGFVWLCGERGIRTPGSPEGEQRFSRPPH
jgi:hypothetical protein